MGTPPPLPLRRRPELLDRPPNHNLEIVIRPHKPSWLARLWRNFLNGWRMFSFHLRPAPYIEEMAKRLDLDRPLLPEPKPELDLIQWPIGEDGTYYPPEPYTVAWYAENATRHMQVIEASKLTTLEAINGMRAAFGYGPLPEEPKPEYEGMQFAQADWKPKGE